MCSLLVKRTAIIISSVLVILIIVLAAFYSINVVHSKPAVTERKVLFWYDPMSPNTKFDKPGKSPFMDMDLLPKYADEESAGGVTRPGVRIDATQTQNLGMRTEKVRMGKLTYAQTLPANVSFNEYQFVIVQSRAEGFIEKVYPLTVGDKVKKATPLIELTIPQWVEAQSEYLLLTTTGGTATQVEGVLERLRLDGMPEEDIQQLRKTKTIQTHFTLRAPIDGVITAFALRTGMNITKDSVVAQIQGMDPVWISAALPESVAYLIKDSSQFTVQVPAYPDKNFKVQKWNTLPSVDTATRTLQVRLQVDNHDELLKPGMNASLTLTTQSPEMLLIPSQAVIDTGSEQRVITLNAEGRFVPKVIKIFHESQQETAVSAGLSAGESVVINGLFLIDSEANIAGALDNMRHDNAAMADVTPPSSAATQQ
ncbi:efflux RND transporter periplasmic adaptor subunit [Rahnella sp. SAP-1]|uniref:Efflux RND transporter periplasmic adaptor subunit n=1 Tax=Rouxiella aceris TaxID=2703884 RepID=A0A848MLA2_9GAMM|nr:efflux RND transporter periplasmic adaptor subunit [Rouxiella aceris]NMP29328.1 efflux RND transporter periplasmic adaptor subunit [Rouxiella aceris]